MPPSLHDDVINRHCRPTLPQELSSSSLSKMLNYRAAPQVPSQHSPLCIALSQMFVYLYNEVPMYRAYGLNLVVFGTPILGDLALNGGRRLMMRTLVGICNGIHDAIWLG